ncbi:MAG: hypothetical protein E6767_12845 [Dysgonomonas sp.]|nr:hypothetical protein [Dysgonomonas sp.]
MADKLFYRELNLGEKEEIERLSNEAKKVLNIEGGLDYSNTLDAINNFLNLTRDKGKKVNIIEKYSYELGSLYGNLFVEKYNWNWYYLEKDREVFYCVSPSNQRVCCAVHNYIFSILTNKHDNNMKLLFNMIKSEYPKDWEFTFLT